MEPETKNNQRELSMEGSRNQMIEGTGLKPQDQETPIQGRNPWIERPVKYINPDGTLKKTKSTFHLFKILKPQSLSKPPLLEHVGIILPSNTNDTNLISKEKTTTNYEEFITAESVDEYIQSLEKNELVSDTVEHDVNQSLEKNELVPDTVEHDVNQSLEKNELVPDTVEDDVNQSHEKNELVSDTVKHDVNQSLEKNELVSDTVEHDVNQSLEKNGLVSDTVEHDVNQSLEKNELVSDTVEHDVNQSLEKNELVSDTVEHDVNQSLEKNELVSDTLEHDVNQPLEKNELVSDSIKDYIVMNKPKGNNQSDETTRSVEDKDLNVVNEQNKLSLKEIQSNKEKGNEKQTGIVGNEVKKNDRGKVIRTGHCCMFCYKVMNKLHRHFQVKHSTEIEIAKLLAMPINSLVRRNGFIDLARIGDYHHNIEVLSKKSGKLIVVRRPSLGEEFSYRKYTPCPYCLGFLLKKHLWLHVKHSCNVRREKSHEEPSAKERRRVQADSRVLLMSSLKRDHNQPAIFIENILQPMRDDKVTETCKNDPLILKLGNSQFEKYGLTKHESIRQEMRQLGRLLLTLRELSEGGDKTLKDWLEPFEIDNLVAAVKQMCIKIDSENQTLQPQYKIPPLAVKLRLSLRRCITIERGEALRNCNKSKSESLKDFLDLMEKQWSIQFASILIDKSQESNKVVDANSEHNLNAEALSVGKDSIPAQVEKLAKHGHNKKNISLKKPTLKRPWTTEEKDAVMTFFHLAIEKQVIPGKKECEQCIRQNSALERRSWRDIKYYIHNYCNKIKKMTTNLSSSKNKKKRSLNRKSDKKVKKSSKDDSDDPDSVQKEERKKTKRPLKKPTLKRPWTPEEKDAVITFFHMAIKKRVVPGKNDCEQCIRQNSALEHRSWRDVKYYVYNNCRKSRKLHSFCHNLK
ncbi:uncharacterized protein LOC128992470 [Macrosteles quadrilineatus]|uniref:uncharacterized protein LOC128992470 n=1 Tax=Macrosteles quadrilineatus TaxID=74068 RepID=UPI0023E32D18|nr:uncharacterized protein LOC128992470 [Macrosteles quadrilineatus]